MFVDPKKLIELKIYYKKIGRHYVVQNEDEYISLPDEDKEKYKCLTVMVRELTWGMYNELNEESITRDIEGKRNFNFRLFKEIKIKKILAGWDAKKTNEAGESVPIPVNPDTINNLSPDIAECILNSYDAEMFISGDEEKK